MSNIADLNQRIAIANAESKRINNERQVNIGKRETLQQQLNSALQKYEADILRIYSCCKIKNATAIFYDIFWELYCSIAI